MASEVHRDFLCDTDTFLSPLRRKIIHRLHVDKETIRSITNLEQQMKHSSVNGKPIKDTLEQNRGPADKHLKVFTGLNVEIRLENSTGSGVKELHTSQENSEEFDNDLHSSGSEFCTDRPNTVDETVPTQDGGPTLTEYGIRSTSANAGNTPNGVDFGGQSCGSQNDMQAASSVNIHANISQSARGQTAAENECQKDKAVAEKAYQTPRELPTPAITKDIKTVSSALGFQDASSEDRSSKAKSQPENVCPEASPDTVYMLPTSNLQADRNKLPVAQRLDTKQPLDTDLPHKSVMGTDKCYLGENLTTEDINWAYHTVVEEKKTGHLLEMETLCTMSKKDSPGNLTNGTKTGISKVTGLESVRFTTEKEPQEDTEMSLPEKPGFFKDNLYRDALEIHHLHDSKADTMVDDTTCQTSEKTLGISVLSFAQRFKRSLVPQKNTVVRAAPLDKTVRYTKNNEQWCYESNRLASFKSLDLPVSPIRLAESGFYYDEEGDKILCFSCGFEKRYWDREKQEHKVRLIHLRNSPTCKHANFTDTRNVPISSRTPTSLPSDPQSQHPNGTGQQGQQARHTQQSFRESRKQDTSTDGESTSPQRPFVAAESYAPPQRSEFTGHQEGHPNEHRMPSGGDTFQTDASPRFSGGIVRTSVDKPPLSAVGKKVSNSSSVEQTADGISTLSLPQPAPDIDSLKRHMQLVAQSAGTAMPCSALPIQGTLGSGQVYLCYTSMQAPSHPSLAAGGSFIRLPVQVTTPATRQTDTTSHDHLPGACGQGGSENASDIPEDLVDDPAVRTLDVKRAASPMNATARARFISFVGWPARSGQNPRTLVLAGFYYLGSGDSVRCWFCGIILRNWRQSDDPWVTHCLFRFSCAYVIAIKGQNFVTQALINRNGSTITESHQQGRQSPTDALPAGNCQQSQRVSSERVEVDSNRNVNAASRENASREIPAAVARHPAVPGGDVSTYSSSAPRSTNAAAANDNTDASSEIAQAKGAVLNQSQASASSAERTVLRDPRSSASSPETSQVSGSSADATGRSAETSQPEATASPRAGGRQGKSKKAKGANKDANNEKTNTTTPRPANATPGRPSQQLEVDSEPSTTAAGSTSNGGGFLGTTISNHQPANLAGASTTMEPASCVSGATPITSGPRPMAGEDAETYYRRILKENRRLRARRTCKICWRNVIDTIFLPCGHLCTCDTCSATIRECCLCYQRIRGTAHVYLE
ncbi:hypothetical protein BaRGS_00016664 [Batillaria attramentaria]|uniref:RING-type domain-containing protein n=1 Tax=Batillaria attramentaria TaxID=370345 RepID=A0ABD0KY32_9CAEN